MDKACDVLANTGSNTLTLLVVSLLVIAVAMSLVVLINRKHGSNYKIFGGGSAALVLMFVLGLSAVMFYPGSANAAGATPDCVTAPGNTTTKATDPNALTLVNDTYSNHNGLYYDNGFGWSGQFDIIANDHAPAGDPIDPASVKLIGDWPDTNSDPGASYWILNPTDPTNPTNPSSPTNPNDPWGAFSYGETCELSPGGADPVCNFAFSVWLADGVPANSTFNIRYTAKTMSGKDASNIATVTITNDGKAEAPKPTLVNDSYSLGTNGGAILDVIQNDEPLPGDPFNSSSLRLNMGDGEDVYTNPDGSSAYSFGLDTIHWQVVGGKVIVTFGPDVPVDTPLSISYDLDTTNGNVASNSATITVTRSAPDNSIVGVTNAEASASCQADYTVNLLDYASTTLGALDPLSIDLDPITPGRQTNMGVNGPSVDSSGILTLGSGTMGLNGTIYFTISNTNGDKSGIGAVNYFNGCG